MQEKSLKVYDGNKTFFSKISTTISKVLIPTKIGLNGMLITLKRNAVIKAYDNYILNINHDDPNKKEALFSKYEDCYTLYLEAVDKHIMDTIYKKVKNNTATNFEKNALSNYYTVINLKNTDAIEYKYRKQKYLLELDFETVNNSKKEKLTERYRLMFIEKMEVIYKGIIKNYSVKLADGLTIKQGKRDEYYEKILQIIEEYITNIFKIKIENDQNSINKDLHEDYEKFEGFLVGKIDAKDLLQKQMIILGMSRQIFTHSLPLVVAEQCYIKLMKEARALIVSLNDVKQKQEKVYQLLIEIIEEYNIKLSSTKVYWEKPEERDNYKRFWDKYKEIAANKKDNVEEFVKQREILFLKEDIKLLNRSKRDYTNIIELHKSILVKYGEIRQLKGNYKKLENTKYIKKVTRAS